MRDIWSHHGVFQRTEISDKQILLRHAIIHNLPPNYHSYVPVALEATPLELILVGDWL